VRRNVEREDREKKKKKRIKRKKMKKCEIMLDELMCVLKDCLCCNIVKSIYFKSP